LGDESLEFQIEVRKVLVTLGDPAGVGPEIIGKLSKREEIYKTGIPVVIGREKFLSPFLPKNVKLKKIFDLKETKSEKFLINIIEPEEEVEEIKIGVPTENSGREALLYIEKACQIIKRVKREKSVSLLTAPVSKKAITISGFKFEGHTEFLRDFFNVREVVMLFVSNMLKVSIYSRHIALKKVSETLDKEKIKSSIKLSIKAVSEMRNIKLKEVGVGVCGFNPHAGEEGEIGKEEVEIIIPALEELKIEGFNISGPMSSDVVFYQALSNKYDFVFAWYHDQGLLPVKLLSSGRGVNLTWGLPFVRTSPLHGTGYSIAGKNIARDESLFEAYKLACFL